MKGVETRRKRWRWATRVLVLLLLGGGAYLYSQYRLITHGTTSVWRYRSILNSFEFPMTDRVAHFPREVPAGARDVRFYYRPGYLQGYEIMELRCKLPAGEVAAAEKQAKAAAQVIVRAEEYPPAATEQFGTLPPLMFRNSANDGFGDIPAGFTLYILRAETSDSKSWDKGVLYGTAVNRGSGEVIWWCLVK